MLEHACLSAAVKRLVAATALLLTFTLPTVAQEKVLNVYNWNDYVAPDTLSKFTAETGIKVNYDLYDGNEILEAKLLAGKSGYDVVFPSASPFFVKQVKAGIYQKLDMSKLKNAGNVDKSVLTELAKYDAGNAHGIPYLMAATGIGYNIAKIKALMPDAPIGDLAMIFDPKVLAKIKGCGVTILDSSDEVFSAALAWIGKTPTSQSDTDLKTASDIVMKARPSYKYIHSSAYINDLANANTCVAMGYAGDLVQARSRAREAKRGVDIGIFIPTQGSAFNIDVMAIPADAPNVDNAHLFIDFLMRPDIMAAVTNATGYANAIQASQAMLDDDIKNDKVIYPPDDVRSKLYTVPPADQAFERARTRAWTRIKTRY
jgi:putrescine transport system substrate-binding protein